MQEFRIYRPNKTKTGAASKFNLSLKKKEKYDEYLLFVETTQQTGIDDNGNASFGWKDQDKRIVMKLEAIDIGEILTVLNGVKNNINEGKGLFHKSPKNPSHNTVLKLERRDNGFGYQLSNKQEKVLSINHMISFAEAEVLRVLLEHSLVKMFDW